jgi:hypothetical protein
MKAKENPVKSVVLTNNEKDEILIRAKRDGEMYPSHKPVRILVDYTVHLVQRCDVLRCALALLFEPERNWKKCPHCGKEKWSVWMPVPIRLHEIWDDDTERPVVYTRLKWYILCFHCANIVANHTANPYGLDDIKEYVYDPADDVEMRLFWPEAPPVRSRGRYGPKS